MGRRTPSRAWLAASAVDRLGEGLDATPGGSVHPERPPDRHPVPAEASTDWRRSAGPTEEEAPTAGVLALVVAT
jgi:hypothetical protein